MTTGKGFRRFVFVCAMTPLNMFSQHALVQKNNGVQGLPMVCGTDLSVNPQLE
jgi:hypothetical protein